MAKMGKFTRWSTASLFLSLLAACYLSAFSSLYTQVPGLYGRHGVLPVHRLESQWPTGCFSANRRTSLSLMCLTHQLSIPLDAVMELLCICGVLLSFVLLVSTSAKPSLVSSVFQKTGWCLAWLLYLSLTTAGQSFLAFQWDALLLEVGFLAPWLSTRTRGSERQLAAFAIRWLLFRLMLASAVVKLESECPLWLSLDALRTHLQSQCLPTPLAWLFYNFISPPLLRLMTAITFIIELHVPFLYLIFTFDTFLPFLSKPLQHLFDSGHKKEGDDIDDNDDAVALAADDLNARAPESRGPSKWLTIAWTILQSANCAIRILRIFAGYATIGLMAAIAATGNFNFNILTMAMAVLCMDDTHVSWVHEVLVRCSGLWLLHPTSDWTTHQNQNQMRISDMIKADSGGEAHARHSDARSEGEEGEIGEDGNEEEEYGEYMNSGRKQLKDAMTAKLRMNTWLLAVAIVVVVFAVYAQYFTANWLHLRFDSEQFVDVKWKFSATTVLPFLKSHLGSSLLWYSTLSLATANIVGCVLHESHSHFSDESTSALPWPLRVLSSFVSLVKIAMRLTVVASVFIVTTHVFLSSMQTTNAANIWMPAIFKHTLVPFGRQHSIANAYGLFRRMTGANGRPEVELFVTDHFDYDSFENSAKTSEERASEMLFPPAANRVVSHEFIRNYQATTGHQSTAKRLAQYYAWDYSSLSYELNGPRIDDNNNTVEGNDSNNEVAYIRGVANLRERINTKMAAESEAVTEFESEYWIPVPFLYKTGPQSTMSPWLLPFQPRLDWQMWFVALGSDYQSSPWLLSLLYRITKHTTARDCDALLLVDFRNYLYSPFYNYFHGILEQDFGDKIPDDASPLSLAGFTRKPVYVKAVSYLYNFTSAVPLATGKKWTAEEVLRRQHWWSRRQTGELLPLMQVRNTAANRLKHKLRKRKGAKEKETLSIEKWMERNGFLKTPRYFGNKNLVSRFIAAIRRWYLKRFHLKLGPHVFVWFWLISAALLRVLLRHYCDTRPNFLDDFDHTTIVGITLDED